MVKALLAVVCRVTHCAQVGYYLSKMHPGHVRVLSSPDFPSRCCVACASGCGILNYNTMIMIKDNLGLWWRE